MKYANVLVGTLILIIGSQQSNGIVGANPTVPQIPGPPLNGFGAPNQPGPFGGQQNFDASQFNPFWGTEGGFPAGPPSASFPSVPPFQGRNNFPTGFPNAGWMHSFNPLFPENQNSGLFPNGVGSGFPYQFPKGMLAVDPTFPGEFSSGIHTAHGFPSWQSPGGVGFPSGVPGAEFFPGFNGFQAPFPQFQNPSYGVPMSNGQLPFWNSGSVFLDKLGVGSQSQWPLQMPTPSIPGTEPTWGVPAAVPPAPVPFPGQGGNGGGVGVGGGGGGVGFAKK